MSIFSKSARQIFASVEETGEARTISEQEVAVWGTEVERVTSLFVSSGGLIYSNRAELDADLEHGSRSLAWVLGDTVAANNGVYGKVGASGTGSWTRRGNLPYSFIVASDVGAGTPNAIQATSFIPIYSSALVWMNVADTTTGSPVTVSFNGGSALAIKTNSGNNIAAGGLVAGMVVLGIVSGATFRLLSDQASSALVAAAELAAEQAIAAASSVQSEQDSRANAIANYHPLVGPNFIRTAGYTTGADGGGALYRKAASQPDHNGKMSITLFGGTIVWYEIVPNGEIDPLMVGAKADGATDDSAALTSAAAVARFFNIPISLRGGRTYVFGTPVAWGKIPGVKGRGVLKYTGAPGEVVTIGGSPGTGKSLSSNALAGSSSLNVAGHGFQSNQMIWIRSGENCLADSAMGNRRLGPTNGADNVRYCEWAQVQSVVDGNNVILNGSTHYAYPGGSTVVYPVDVLDQLVLEEFTFDGGGVGMIALEYLRNPSVKRSCMAKNQGEAGFVIEHVIGGQIDPCILRNANSDNPSDPSAYQGVKVRDGCQDVNLTPYVTNGEQGVDVTYTPSSAMNGNCRNIRVFGGQFLGVNQQAVTSHEGTESLIVEGNTIEDGGDGISVRGPLSIIRNNKIRGRATAVGNEGVRIGNAYANSTLVEGNDISLMALGVTVIGNSAALRRDETIRGNRIKKCGTGILVTQKQAATLNDYGLRVSDNEVIDCVDSGIVVEDNISGSVVNDNVVRQESGVPLTTYAVRIGAGSNLEASRNRAIDVGSSISVLDLSNTATGRFKDNVAIGSALPSDTNAGAEFDLIVSVADDAVFSLPIQSTTMHIRVASSSAKGNGQASLATGVVNYVSGNPNFAAATGILNGTSGIDGNVTVSKPNASLYLENRSGVALTFRIRITCE